MNIIKKKVVVNINQYNKVKKNYNLKNKIKIS